jgi:hypothetical protein
MGDVTTIYAAFSGAGVYYSTNSGVDWQVLDNTGLWLDVAGLALDATQRDPTLYAATLGRGMHEFTVHTNTSLLFFLQSPPGPYPFEASTSDISVTTSIEGGVASAFWSTNRGHVGTMTRQASAPRGPPHPGAAGDRVEPHHADGHRRVPERGEHLAHR